MALSQERAEVLGQLASLRAPQRQGRGSREEVLERVKKEQVAREAMLAALKQVSCPALLYLAASPSIRSADTVR